jgi:hypothetical protein
VSRKATPRGRPSVFRRVKAGIVSDCDRSFHAWEGIYGSSEPAEVEQAQIRTAFGDGGRSHISFTGHWASGKDGGFDADWS